MKELRTTPLEGSQIPWAEDAKSLFATETDLLDPDLLTIRLRISTVDSASENGSGRNDQERELQVAMIKPIRLGRLDPKEGVYPEVDLTDAKMHGVSREHVCLYRRGHAVEVEDLGSTNGTLLNGVRLKPYKPTFLNDGDQLQLGQLLVEVNFDVHPLRGGQAGNGASGGLGPA
jgi:pSer/pThr/pTyr-binding forkhead associated (FHA) protein